ncbi:MAG: HAMP domain-containing protein [Deltaproteobacteria bacterium]|nr:HAMP domain-containing protein [Deltaproteobacteria bacterium]
MIRDLLALLRGTSLRTRLVVPLSAIITLIVGGQVATSLSEKLEAYDHHVQSEGTVMAQGVASSCVELMDGAHPHRFDEVIARVRESLDLMELAIVSRDGEVLAHTNRSRVGSRIPPEKLHGMTLRRRPPSLLGLFRGYTEHDVGSPIMRGTTVLGHVTLRFRTDEMRDQAVASLVAAAAAGAFWLVLGAFIATLYVRRITRPLGELTAAAGAVTRNALDTVDIPETPERDEVGVLQSAFRELVRDVRDERARNARLVTELRDLNENLAARVLSVTADLRQAKAYLESVLECMEEGIITADGEGKVVSANRGARLHLARLGQPDAGVQLGALLPDDGERLVHAARAAAAGAAQRVELTCRPPGAMDLAEARDLVFHLYPLRTGDSGGGVVVTLVDVTRERKAEAALRRHDRLISMGTMAAGLAHEMGNYMNSIQGYCSLLLRAMPPDDACRADVKEIHDQNARAIALLERFREFARPRDIRFSPEDPDALVREAVVMARYRLRKAQVRVVEELGLAGFVLRCDGQMLKQVFVNLIFNAVDALEGQAEKVITVRSRCSGDNVELEFQDNGSGIDAAHLEKIFDPFFTTKVATGTGLGLSIAHQVVERHRGRIRVQSAPGHGATFSIMLPVNGREPEAT